MAMNGAVTIRKIWKSNQAIKESEHHKYEDMNAELEQHAMHCFKRMTTLNGMVRSNSHYTYTS